MGLLAGLVAALLMIVLILGARILLGISPPPEAIPDRFAPTLDIDTFFSLFGRFGGYNGLKRFGIISGLSGLLAAGVIVGIVYTLIVESRRSRLSGRWQDGLSRIAVGCIIAAGLVIWLITVVIMWPVLDANYRGLPPGPAMLVSAAALLVEYLVFAAGVIFLYRWVVSHSVPAGEPVPFGVPV